MGYGSEDPSWLHSQPSNKCGSPNKNTTNPALELYTENASKLIFSFRIHAYEGNRKYISKFIFLSHQLDKIFFRIMFSNLRRLFSNKEILMFLTNLATRQQGNKHKHLITGKFSSKSFISNLTKTTSNVKMLS